MFRHPNPGKFEIFVISYVCMYGWMDTLFARRECAGGLVPRTGCSCSSQGERILRRIFHVLAHRLNIVMTNSPEE